MNDAGERSSPTISFEFGSERSAPRAARAALEPMFPDDGVLADDVGLVASELVSNVILHTGGGGQLDAWADDPIRLEVRDHSPQLPRPGTGPDQVGGRGLRIVASVADRWGSRRAGDGKLIWAEFSR